MTNINLKYLAISIVLLSFLMVGGVYLFSLINKPKLPAQNPSSRQPIGRCTIGSNQFVLGDNPENECQVCDPVKNQDSWTNKDKSATCRNKIGICVNGRCIPNVPPATGSGGGSAPK